VDGEENETNKIQEYRSTYTQTINTSIDCENYISIFVEANAMVLNFDMSQINGVCPNLEGRSLMSTFTITYVVTSMPMSEVNLIEEQVTDSEFGSQVEVQINTLLEQNNQTPIEIEIVETKFISLVIVEKADIDGTNINPDDENQIILTETERDILEQQDSSEKNGLEKILSNFLYLSLIILGIAMIFILCPVVYFYFYRKEKKLSDGKIRKKKKRDPTTFKEEHPLMKERDEDEMVFVYFKRIWRP